MNKKNIQMQQSKFSTELLIESLSNADIKLLNHNAKSNLTYTKVQKSIR